MMRMIAALKGFLKPVEMFLLQLFAAAGVCLLCSHFGIAKEVVGYFGSLAVIAMFCTMAYYVKTRFGGRLN